ASQSIGYWENAEVNGAPQSSLSTRESQNHFYNPRAVVIQFSKILNFWRRLLEVTTWSALKIPVRFCSIFLVVSFGSLLGQDFYGRYGEPTGIERMSQNEFNITSAPYFPATPFDFGRQPAP